MKLTPFCLTACLAAVIAMPTTARSTNLTELKHGATTCGLNFRHSSAHNTCPNFNTDGSSWAGCVINASCKTAIGKWNPTSIKLPERQVRDLLNCNGTLQLKC